MSVVAVTGASGFVGANLARRLVERGDDVHVLLRPQAKTWRLDGIEVRRHVVDLADEQALTRTFENIRPDVVAHLAAYGAYASQRDVHFAVRTNVESTIMLMDCARAAGVRRFINTGSSSEYGYKDHAPDEAENVFPNSLYAVTKVAATHYGAFLAATAGFHVTTLRLYSVYGPFEEPTRLIPTLIMHGQAGTLPPLVAPSVARDYVYVDDVVSAYESVIDAEIPAGRIYNVGSGRQTTLAEVVDVTRKRFSITQPIAWGSMPAKGWDTDTWIANVQRIASDTGWRPLTAFDAGFDRTAAWLTAVPERFSFYQTARALPT